MKLFAGKKRMYKKAVAFMVAMALCFVPVYSVAFAAEEEDAGYSDTADEPAEPGDAPQGPDVSGQDGHEYEPVGDTGEEMPAGQEPGGDNDDDDNDDGNDVVDPDTDEENKDDSGEGDNGEEDQPGENGGGVDSETGGGDEEEGENPDGEVSDPAEKTGEEKEPGEEELEEEPSIFDRLAPKVSITAPDVTVKVGEESFALLDDVAAKDENGEPVDVTVVDDGGFDVTVAGNYTVIYEAVHPASEEAFAKERTVSVVGFVFDPQPESAEAVQELVDDMAPGLEGLMALPKWEFAIDEEWLPAGWRQAAFEDEEYGVTYWRLVVGIKPMAGEISDYNSLKAAVAAIPSGGEGTIVIDGDFTFDEAIKISDSKTVKFELADGINGAVLSTKDEGQGEKYRHFHITGGTVNLIFEDGIVLDGGKEMVGSFHNTDSGGILVAGGTVTIDGATLENCYAYGYAGAIHQSGGTLTVKNSTIDDCFASNNTGGIGVRGGSLSVYDTVITGTKAVGSGANGAIRFQSSGSLWTERVTITGSNMEKDGGGIWIAQGTDAVIYDCDIIGNTAGEEGGGIYVYDSTNIFVSNTRIQGNTATKGGGIYVENAQVTVKEESVISGGEATQGAGVFVTNSSTFILDDSTIKDNNSKTNGGGIMVDGSGATEVIVRNKSVIDNNTARAGGGINVTSHTVRISDSKVTNNKALTTSGTGSLRGGGFHISRATVTVEDGSEISGNTSEGIGGAMHITGIASNQSQVTIDASAVVDNRSEAQGGAIYATFGNISVINGTVLGSEVKGNKAADSGGGVYIINGTFDMNGGEISGSIAEAGSGGAIYAKPTTAVQPVIVLTDVKLNNNQAAEGNGGAVYFENADVTINGATMNGNKALQSAQENASAYNTTTGAGGSVYVTGADTNMNANGLIITGSQAVLGGGMAVEEGTVSIDNASITGNDAVAGIGVSGRVGNGGGLFAVGGTVTVNGGSISKNTAAGRAGNVYAGDHYFSNLASVDLLMQDVTVAGGSAMQGGGVAVDGASSFEATGTTIIGGMTAGDGNQAQNGGGGIYGNRQSTIVLSGQTKVIGNKAVTGGGGGINSSTSVVIKDKVVIEGNTAAGGGGINMMSLGNTEALKIETTSGAAIRNNSAGGSGGGIALMGGLVINGDLAISGNSAKDGGGIYATLLQPNYELKMSGNIAFSNNTASQNGGAIWVETAALSRVHASAGVSFTNNKASAAYTLTDGAHRSIHGTNILSTVFTAPFENAYNNYDIAYISGDLVVNKVMVNFESDGGTPVASVTVNEGSRISEPANVTKDGFKLSGWYTAGGTKWNFADMVVDADMTLYARWEKVPGKFTVTFNANGGSFVGYGNTYTTQAEEGKTVDFSGVPDIVRAGYIFDGKWYKDAACTRQWATTDLMDDKALALYAGWVKEEEKPGGETPGSGGNTDGGGSSGGGSNIPDDLDKDKGQGQGSDGDSISFGGGSEVRDIYAGDIPMAEALLALIGDDGIPLSTLPKTGSDFSNIVALAGGLALGTIYLVGRKKI